MTWIISPSAGLPSLILYCGYFVVQQRNTPHTQSSFHHRVLLLIYFLALCVSLSLLNVFNVAENKGRWPGVTRGSSTEITETLFLSQQ